MALWNFVSSILPFSAFFVWAILGGAGARGVYAVLTKMHKPALVAVWAAIVVGAIGVVFTTIHLVRMLPGVGTAKQRLYDLMAMMQFQAFDWDIVAIVAVVYAALGYFAWEVGAGLLGLLKSGVKAVFGLLTFVGLMIVLFVIALSAGVIPAAVQDELAGLIALGIVILVVAAGFGYKPFFAKKSEGKGGGAHHN